MNIAFCKDRGLRKNAENIIFALTSKYSGRNLPSHQHHTMIKKLQSINVSSGIPGKMQDLNLKSMSLIGNFDIWEEFGIFDIEG